MSDVSNLAESAAASQQAVATELAKSDAVVAETLTTVWANKRQAVTAPEAPAPEAPSQDASADPVVSTEPETPAVATPPPSPVEPPKAPEDNRLRLYAEREVALRKLQREIEDKEAQLSAQVEAARKARDEELKGLIDVDPDEFFKVIGGDYETLTKRMTERKPDPMTIKLKKEHEELRRKFEEKEAEAAQARQIALRDRALMEVRTFVDTSENHPLTKAAGMADEVLSVITEHYRVTGEELSEVAAADQVEAYLAGLVEKLTSARAPRATPPTEQAPKTPTTPTTITNKQAATVPARSNPDDLPLLDWEESVSRAAKSIRFRE